MAQGFWVRANQSDSHAGLEASVDTIILSNAGSSLQENRRLTSLGYYLTVFSATSLMYVARLLVVPEMIDAGDLTSSIPEDDDDMVWAKHYAHAGVPGYFQIKSKRTLGPDDRVFLQTYCVSNPADDIQWSWQSYVVGSG